MFVNRLNICKSFKKYVYQLCLLDVKTGIVSHSVVAIQCGEPGVL